ncbi:MAG: peptide-methionine (R)-S-oxide reductase MsrB [Ferruginibacter sp.]|nr:peptide-methionine (R)-S-oxide reductase MsrB [Ferruginibacter sp.]
MTRIIQILVAAGMFFTGCNTNQHHTKDTIMTPAKPQPGHYSKTDTAKLNLSDEEWKKALPADVYNIAREKGTERAFTGKYNLHKDTGTYYCAACGNPLFNSNGKFESSCGWPSFFEPITKGSLIYAPDNSHGMQRTEVNCGRCKAHLGHVFEDGPPPTGLRYCINSVILDFEAAKKAGEQYGK